MKIEVEQIVGKTIAGVVIKSRKTGDCSPPQSQMYLVFDDNTTYEFYCMEGDLSTTGGVSKDSSFREVLGWDNDHSYVELLALIDGDTGQVSCTRFEESELDLKELMKLTPSR